ncbi:unnamed protein product [Gongylonema pulchrum]|uniref:MARVEL domain-containing protein n=1 Tax=Gongylonema pulchrum TaxID=637853 RepID=A0A183EDX9_9BILA|nr:unnamed protein product [Gongylonema pulchrum]
MGMGHRALFVWVLLLLALIFLVVYLDGGLDGEPSLFFAVLLFFDAIFLSLIAIRVVRHYQICGVGRRRAAVYSIKIWRDPGVLACSAILAIPFCADCRNDTSSYKHT